MRAERFAAMICDRWRGEVRGGKGVTLNSPSSGGEWSSEVASGGVHGARPEFPAARGHRGGEKDSIIWLGVNSKVVEVASGGVQGGLVRSRADGKALSSRPPISAAVNQAVDEVPRIFQFGGSGDAETGLSFEIICAVTAALMLEVFKMDEEMSEHETELLFAGWYSTMRSKLKLMHVLKSFEMGRGSKLFIPIWDKMASNWDSLMIDLENMFMDFIQLTDGHFLNKCFTPESFVFYHKTKGDYYQYISGLTVSAKKKTYAVLSAESYKAIDGETRKAAVRMIEVLEQFLVSLGQEMVDNEDKRNDQGAGCCFDAPFARKLQTQLEADTAAEWSHHAALSCVTENPEDDVLLQFIYL
ncbi:hypothetical protein E2562_031113 [Oryza meyeriana var. granulata]|uniref:14-3-3 domain-containing protein n=1 Tax=Oryza meyeriana var. granulata TaxID=110450 RepID=A0A6G1DPV5_9ORYZ|nr:hypothetical protein E2562_031113 [Oryza meyeriana var. granulata]